MTTRMGWLAATIALGCFAGPAHSQALSSIDTTLSRGVLGAAATPSCAARSSVVRVCDSPTVVDATVGASTRSVGRGGDDAFANASTTDTATAQHLDAVTVVGRRVPRRRSIEAILQDALAPSTAIHNGPLEAHAGSAGTRYECYAACTGPDCCIEVRTTPNPARESNLIGR